jgi:RNA recognition motif
MSAPNAGQVSVQNVDRTVSADELFELFSRFCSVAYVTIIPGPNPDLGGPNSAIVYLNSEGDAQKGADAVNNMSYPFHGRQLQVTVTPVQ